MAAAEESERAGGWSPLMTAAEAGDAAGAAAAIAAGAEVNAADEDGWTALHLAALNDRAAVVELLLAQPGIDVNARTKWRSTPLILAVSRGHVGAGAAPARPCRGSRSTRGPTTTGGRR